MIRVGKQQKMDKIMLTVMTGSNASPSFSLMIATLNNALQQTYLRSNFTRPLGESR